MSHVKKQRYGERYVLASFDIKHRSIIGVKFLCGFGWMSVIFEVRYLIKLILNLCVDVSQKRSVWDEPSEKDSARRSMCNTGHGSHRGKKSEGGEKPTLFVYECL